MVALAEPSLSVIRVVTAMVSALVAASLVTLLAMVRILGWNLVSILMFLLIPFPFAHATF